MFRVVIKIPLKSKVSVPPTSHHAMVEAGREKSNANNLSRQVVEVSHRGPFMSFKPIRQV